MKNRFLMLVVVVLIVLGYSSICYAPQPVGSKETKERPQKERAQEGVGVSEELRELREPPIRLPDNPRIRQFSITPNYWVQGQPGTAIIRWQVESGPGGSPVNSITITGPELNYSSSNSNDQCNVNILSYPFPQTLTYTLTAVNNAGRTARRELQFEIKSPVEIREQISFEGVYTRTQPARFPEGSPYTVIFRINNRSPVRLSGVVIKIGYRQSTLGVSMASPIGEDIPTRIELRDQIINPGINEYRFTDTLSVIDGEARWRVGHLRGQYFIYIYYHNFLMLCCPVPILNILVSQTEPQLLFRVRVQAR